jgi:N-acetyl-beta-hexosaminidase
MKYLFSCFLLLCFLTHAQAQNQKLLPVRGFCIAAPTNKDVPSFVKFIDEELEPRHVNTLILCVDFNYQYKTHAELRDSAALSEADIKKIVSVCKANQINLIPQINLLGHQSWANTTHNLLRVYPQFDETPHVQMPEKYEWPNADGLYCKSYCPLHPDVHKIVFEMVDELCDVFETNAFHAGMDEVFYIGDDQCPRCSGHDKAQLFANEIRTIRDHLATKNRKLWIWGDRLLDGKITGLGMWEASMNNTHRAIDMIPKDVMICDWHYERPDKTPVYFVMKGLNVITCPWHNPSNGVIQYQDMVNFRATATDETRERYQGMMQTVWSDAGSFMKGFYSNTKDEKGGENTPWHCFKALYNEMNKVK